MLVLGYSMASQGFPVVVHVSIKTQTTRDSESISSTKALLQAVYLQEGYIISIMRMVHTADPYDQPRLS